MKSRKTVTVCQDCTVYFITTTGLLRIADPGFSSDDTPISPIPNITRRLALFIVRYCHLVIMIGKRYFCKVGRNKRPIRGMQANIGYFIIVFVSLHPGLSGQDSKIDDRSFFNLTTGVDACVKGIHVGTVININDWMDMEAAYGIIGLDILKGDDSSRRISAGVRWHIDSTLRTSLGILYTYAPYIDPVIISKKHYISLSLGSTALVIKPISIYYRAAIALSIKTYKSASRFSVLPSVDVGLSIALL